MAGCGVDVGQAHDPLAAAHAPSDIQAEPAPDDEPEDGEPVFESGAEATVSWLPPEDDTPDGMELKGYRIYQAEDDGDFAGLLIPASTEAAEDDAARVETQATELWTWKAYRFKVAALYGPPLAEGEKKETWYVAGAVKPENGDDPVPYVVHEALSTGESGEVRTTAKLYSVKKTNILVCFLAFAAIVVWYIRHARSGGEIYIRPIAGMEAIDEAIGRATEMGKPILYVCGLSGLGSISTITSLTILGRVARRTADYETPLLVPCADPLVMLAAREIVREAYADAGKPDAYREQDIFFVTDRQFAYVLGVAGIMLRELPSANIFMGYFFAESLILAETGAVTGAIQIAGTDADTQIPFFVTACDYTLMGEELYAATAYLSRDPLLLAQLKAQDIGKAAMGVVIALGTVAMSVAVFLGLGSPGAQKLGETVIWCLDLLGTR